MKINLKQKKMKKHANWFCAKSKRLSLQIFLCQIDFQVCSHKKWTLIWRLMCHCRQTSSQIRLTFFGRSLFNMTYRYPLLLHCSNLGSGSRHNLFTNKVPTTVALSIQYSGNMFCIKKEFKQKLSHYRQEQILVIYLKFILF